MYIDAWLQSFYGEPVPEIIPIRHWLTSCCVGYQIRGERWFSIHEGTVLLKDGSMVTVWQLVAHDNQPQEVPNTYLQQPRIDVKQGEVLSQDQLLTALKACNER